MGLRDDPAGAYPRTPCITLLGSMFVFLVLRLPAAQSRNVDDQLDSALRPLYVMTNGFLDDIIQTKTLADLQKSVPMDSINDLINGFPTYWSDWIVYLIGFTVCGAIGLVTFVVMLIAAMVFPCCRCCGRCGARDPKDKGHRGKSKCCTVATEVVLAVVMATVLGVNVPMYFLNERFIHQVKDVVFTDLDSGLEGINKFMHETVSEMNAATYDEFVALEGRLFTKLDNVPTESITAIDNATQAKTTLDGLAAFSANLSLLNSTLYAADELAATLQVSTNDLWANFTTVQNSVLVKLAGCSPSCQVEIDLVNGTQVSVNFSAVQLMAAKTAVEVAIDGNLPGQIATSLAQFTDVENSVNESVAPSTADVKDNCKQAETDINSTVSGFNDTVNSIDIQGIQKQIKSGQDVISPYADIAYYVILAICIVVSLVVATGLIGLTLGILLPPRRHSTPGSGACCSRDRSAASHLLMTSAALTFIVHWLFMLLVCILFVVGGLVHTEACRHVVNYDNSKSADVLAVLDRWINNTLSSNVEVMPFDAYSQCAKPNVTLYIAMKMDKFYNLTAALNTDQVDKAIADLKTTNISIPTVNITNNELQNILLQLDSALSPQSLDIPGMLASVSGSVTRPDLKDLVTILTALDTSQTAIDLSAEISSLQWLIQNGVQPIETGRDSLVQLLQTVQSLIGGRNFSADSVTLQTGQDIINTDGNNIVSVFVNATADSIDNDVTAVVDRATRAIESDVGQCRPFYDSMTTIIDTTCVRTIYPLNGFWFCLGWSITFLIPGLVLSVQLVSVYRYTAAVNAVGHDDGAYDDVIQHSSRTSLPPTTKPKNVVSPSKASAS